MECTFSSPHKHLFGSLQICLLFQLAPLTRFSDPFHGSWGTIFQFDDQLRRHLQSPTYQSRSFFAVHCPGFLGITQNVQRISVNYVRMFQGSRCERENLIYGQDKCRVGYLIYLSLYI